MDGNKNMQDRYTFIEYVMFLPDTFAAGSAFAFCLATVLPTVLLYLAAPSPSSDLSEIGLAAADKVK